MLSFVWEFERVFFYYNFYVCSLVESLFNFKEVFLLEIFGGVRGLGEYFGGFY